MNEARFIAALKSLPLHDGARGLEDDCAVVALGDETLVLTTDMMAQGTHFRPDADMADVAWKLVAANLSDLAAKGAEPIGILLGHSLGGDDARFLAGLEAALRELGTVLLGGDTIAASGPPTFSITAIGRASHVPVPSRRGAQAGDRVYVTGVLGRAMLGFEGMSEHLTAFNRPVPRLGEGRALAPHVTAMMDISDGLLLDSWRMASASGKTIRLSSAAIPVADRARWQDCVRWGDDYELLFTAPDNAALPIAATCIGVVDDAGDAPLMLDETALHDAGDLGYQHG
ncbi:MAG: thiamine-phosphate kinase [Erythrobacter sp.]